MAITCQPLTQDGQSRALMLRIFAQFISKETRLNCHWLEIGQAPISSSKIHQTSPNRVVTPKKVENQNYWIFLDRSLEIVCFFRGYEQLSSSIGREVMIGQIQCQNSGFVVLTGQTIRFSLKCAKTGSYACVYLWNVISTWAKMVADTLLNTQRMIYHTAKKKDLQNEFHEKQTQTIRMTNEKSLYLAVFAYKLKPVSGDHQE